MACCVNSKELYCPTCELCGEAIHYTRNELRNMLKDFVVSIETPSDWATIYQPTVNLHLLCELLPTCITTAIDQIISIKIAHPTPLLEEEYHALDTILSLTDELIGCIAIQIELFDETLAHYNVYLLFNDLAKLTTRKPKNKHSYRMDPKSIYTHSDRDTINVVNGYDVLYDNETSSMEIG